MTSSPKLDGRPPSRRRAAIRCGTRRRRLLLAGLAGVALAIGYAGIAQPTGQHGRTTTAATAAVAAAVRAVNAAPVAAPVAAVAVAVAVEPAPSGARIPASAGAVQERLVALRYLPAAGVTGTWDYRTAQAVTAFQAWQGLGRDGTVGPLTRAALATAVPPQPAQPGRGRRIEVYREKGVTLLIEGSRVIRAVHSSSGRPGYDTPLGTYSVFRKELDSWSYPYGTWLPYASYFDGGVAFHAYADVPAYPASHGCVRIPAPDAPQVYRFASLGTPVSVY